MKIFATRRIPQAGFQILERAGTVEIGVEPEDLLVPEETVVAGVKGADVLVSLLTERIDREVMEAGT